VCSVLSVTYRGQFSGLQESEGIWLACGHKFESVVFEFIVTKVSEK